MSLKFKLTPTKSLLRCLLDSVECIPPPRPKSCLLYSFIDTSHPIMIQIHALLPEILRKCWKTPCDVKFRENPFSSSRVILLTNQQTKHPLAEIFTLRESPPFHPYMCHFRVVSLPNTLAFCVHSFTRYKPTIPSEPGQRYAGIKCWIEKKKSFKGCTQHEQTQRQHIHGWAHDVLHASVSQQIFYSIRADVSALYGPWKAAGEQAKTYVERMNGMKSRQDVKEKDKQHSRDSFSGSGIVM